MSDELYKFFMEPAQKLENLKVVISPRFKNADGKPIEWELKPVGYGTIARLREEAVKKTSVEMNGKSVTLPLPSMAKFDILLCVESVVFPDLKAKALQDSYKAHSEHDLLQKMLTAPEIDWLVSQANIASGYGESMDEKVEKAKNS